MEVVAVLFIPTIQEAVQTGCEMKYLQTGSSRPKPLDTSLLKHIFEAYGETEIAQNESLLKEMIESATGLRVMNETSSKEESTDEGTEYTSLRYQGSHLDVKTFARGLTFHVELYDVQNEVRLTTNYQDVFASESGKGSAETQ